LTYCTGKLQVGTWKYKGGMWHVTLAVEDKHVMNEKPIEIFYKKLAN
jgi:hypothetical protein